MRVGGARPPALITFTLTSKVAVYAPAEWTDTLTLFHLYENMYSVVLSSYSWTVHHNFSDDGYSEYATVAVSKQKFSTGKQKNSFIVMVQSEFFI